MHIGVMTRRDGLSSPKRRVRQGLTQRGVSDRRRWSRPSRSQSARLRFARFAFMQTHVDGRYGSRKALELLRQGHASWLSTIELSLLIVQRKALTPNDFPNLQALTDGLTTFAEHYRTIARPFRLDLHPQRPRPGPPEDRRLRARPPTRGLTIKQSGQLH